MDNAYFAVRKQLNDVADADGNIPAGTYSSTTPCSFSDDGCTRTMTVSLTLEEPSILHSAALNVDKYVVLWAGTCAMNSPIGN